MEHAIFRAFDGKNVFITGATGFVGGRLTELLAENSTASLKVLVRDYGKAMRVGRYPVDFVKGNLEDETFNQEILQNIDYVFHCAYGNKGDAKSREKVNIEGTDRLLKAAHQNGAKAFVFLSTVSVYGISNEKELTEDSVCRPDASDSYALNKLQAEQEVLAFAKAQSYHAVVLQPTAVYGPWSPSYVMKPMTLMQKFIYPLIDGGAGRCNAVYVDDLCQAMLLAATSSNAQGQKYLINGTDRKTWQSYFEKLASLDVANTVLQSISSEEMKNRAKIAGKKKSLWKIVPRLLTINRPAVRELLQYSFFSRLAGFLIKNMPEKWLKKIITKPGVKVGQGPKKMLVFDQYTINFYSSKMEVNPTKAIKELGYQPEFDLDAGFKVIKNWYQWYYGQGE